ncbi:MAG: methyl-accepting chemotaxis protein, partial [Myxococcales bacterium]|nr:methyl-accepting chemotaxis protein [Myxococcales bacterium]
MSIWWGRLPIQRKLWMAVGSTAGGAVLLTTLLEWIRAGVILGEWRGAEGAAAAVSAIDRGLSLQQWCVGLLCVAMAVGVSWWVASRLAGPIEGLARAFEDGTNPASAVPAHCEDEIAQIALANVMEHGERAPSGDLIEAAGRLSQAIRATMADAGRTAGRGDEYNAQIEQVAAAIEEMSATIVSVAQSTSEAHGNADDACRTAREGGERVGKAIDGMRKIHARVNDIAQTIRTLGTSSEKIGEIVDVIYDIADQTNLLALNAAI